MRVSAVCNLISFSMCLIVIGAVVFSFFDPAKTAKVMTVPNTTDFEAYQADIEQSNQVVQGRIWTEPVDALQGSVLSQLSLAAEKRGAQIVDLRFDKILSVAGLQECPFSVIVSGSFSNVMDFIAAIERPDSKFGVEMLQLSPADSGPAAVKATLRLTAFLGSST